MRAADRAVGWACVILGLVGVVATFLLTALVETFIEGFRGAQPTFDAQRGWYTNPVPLDLAYLVGFIPSLIVGLTGRGIIRGKKLGFQFAVALGVLAAMVGHSGNVFGVALAAYGVLRLAQLFPDAEPVRPKPAE